MGEHPKTALIVSYFLSKWNTSSYKWLFKSLEVSGKTRVHKRVAEILNCNHHTVKHDRDRFDAIHDETDRAGYHQESLPPSRQKIADIYCVCSEQTLRIIVAGILSLDLEPPDVDDIEQEVFEVPEGKENLKMHRDRERNREIILRKKQQTLEATGSLECEGCVFNFKDTYGDHGEGFIECHHTKPISEMKPSDTTKLDDLVLVCSNCHRMIHRKRVETLSMDQLRDLIKRNK